MFFVKKKSSDKALKWAVMQPLVTGIVFLSQIKTT